MIAMKSATDNAGDLIDELQLIYEQRKTGCDYTRIIRNCQWCSGRISQRTTLKFKYKRNSNE